MFSKYKPLFLDQATIPLNWNPATIQSSSFYSSVSLFCPTSFGHTPPQVLDIPKHMPSQINQIYYQRFIQIIILYGSNTLPIKKLSHQEPLSFKVIQHVQQQLYLQYKIHWILYKMLEAPSFSEPYLRKQLPLHSPPKIRSSTLVNFHHPILPLLVHRFILAIPTNTSFLYTSTIFDFPIFPY